MSDDKIYRCRLCYTPMRIPMRFAHQNIDGDMVDGVLRATGQINCDYLCLECQIKESKK